MRLKRKRTGTFAATGSDGKQYTVYEFAAAFLEGGGDAEGAKSLETSCGRKLNRLRKGEYQIVGSTVTLRSSDSNAP